MFILDLSHATHKRVKRIPTIGAMPISNIVLLITPTTSQIVYRKSTGTRLPRTL